MKKVPYIIVAPPYRRNSAGIRVLYELRRHLEGRGYSAQTVQAVDAPYDAIVVYPEVVSGNPVHGRTVARYVLNYPGLLGGDKKYDPREIIFTFIPRFYSDVPVLTVPMIEEFFRDEGLPRAGGCFWVGKGRNVPKMPETEGLVEITPDWPADRKELARLFNEKEVFFSYDDTTALVAEAKYCGCRAVVLPAGEVPGPSYDEFIKDFDTQLDDFIRITQAAAQKEMTLSFGVLVSGRLRSERVLRQSEVAGNIHTIKNPESITKGLNKLLAVMEGEGADVAVLCHQDMFFPQGWTDQVKEQLRKLPGSWVAAGVFGKDLTGRICGTLHDMRIPHRFNTADIHEFPQPACCLDECCIVVNLRKGFRFAETLDGFDLHGTLAVLQAWKMRGTAWIIDAPAEHYCMRPLSWFPDKMFQNNFIWMLDRFPDATRIDATVLE